MANESPLIQAAKVILKESLALPNKAEVAIFLDETTRETATLLIETAFSLDLNVVPLYFPKQVQIDLADKPVALVIENVLQSAEAALICLNGSSECLLFRDQLRQLALSLNCRVAHMPGIDQSTLLLANTDYTKLRYQCEMIALALAKGRTLEITTYAQAGEVNSLHVPLNPWKRLPIISDGMIQIGAWGNVPSGETYIAPPEGLATGSIVINGSLPDYKIPPGQEVILHFEQGRLVEWRPPAAAATLHLAQGQIAFARSHEDSNWSNLAEIGIGVNPLVRELTGNPLLDEKKYGTLHIAIGDNIDMGGIVESRIHCDMVCLSPKVTVDGKVIVEGGEIVLKLEDWCEDHRQLVPHTGWTDASLIKRTATDAQIDEQGRLRRVWYTSSGRSCSVQIGNEETTKLLARLYRRIQKLGKPANVHDLGQGYMKIDETQVFQLLCLLEQYEIIEMVNGQR